MGIFDKHKAKREAKRRAAARRYINERTDIYTVDPASTALLLSTMNSAHGHRHDDVDTYDSESDRYTTSASDYSSGSSYDSGSSSSSDSGSSCSSSD